MGRSIEPCATDSWRRPSPLWNSGLVDVDDMLLFAKVVEAGSFTGAAAVLKVPLSTVSRRVAELENRLKSRLLHRTTRKLALTDAGRTYYEFCSRITAEFEDAERAMKELHVVPAGSLRVTTPLSAGYLGPMVGDFLGRFPDVRLEILSTARNVDLVQERFDLAIRAGAQPDSTWIARTLGTVSYLLVAAPAYLDAHGRPGSPEELKQHDCSFLGSGLDGMALRLIKGDATARLTLRARMTTTDIEILRAVTLAGRGIAALPTFLSNGHLRARRLERVLRDWSVPPIPVHAVYPSRRNVSPNVKAFVDHLQRMMKTPWERSPSR
jgi:DNA-binding transcriptional LysR family regulator